MHREPCLRERQAIFSFGVTPMIPSLNLRNSVILLTDCTKLKINLAIQFWRRDLGKLLGLSAVYANNSFVPYTVN